MAAVVSTAAGFGVPVLPRGAGTSLVDQARRMAAAMAGRLGEAAARGVPIVGAEPSCLLTLRDEHLALLPDHPGAQALAAATRLPEELLVEAIASDRLVLPPENDLRGRRILFHGHCHHKALQRPRPHSEQS